MDVNVDIGGNLTTLLQQLAQQIGTTVDKIYPWYVQQAYVEGLTTLVMVVVLFFVFGVALIVSLANLKNNDDVYGPIAFISGMALAITLSIGTFEGVDAARKLMNPNYYAMQKLTVHVGNLTRK